MHSSNDQSVSGLRTLNVLVGASLVLAILYTLWAAASLVVPILLALLFYLVLSPLVARLHRLGLTRPVATGLLVGLLFGTLGGLGWLLIDPAGAWLARAPESMAAVQRKLSVIIEPLQQVERASAQVGAMATEGETQVQRVTLEDNALKLTLFEGTSQFLASIVIIVVLTTFLLVTGGRIGRNLAGLLPNRSAARRALTISAVLKRELSLYLFTITCINVCLAFVSTLVLWLLGLPNPALFGAMMGLLNFIPYLGPAATMTIVFLVGAITFPQIGQAFLPPLALFGLNVIEGTFLTPTLIAMRLSLNTVMVVLSLILWGWLWGVPGMLIAVPLLAVAKIVCDHVPGLEALGRVIGERREAVPTAWLAKSAKRLGLPRPVRSFDHPDLKSQSPRPRPLKQLG